MTEWIRLVAAIFATYRLAGLISSEEGPYLPFLYKDIDQKGVFEWIRMRIGANSYSYTYDKNGHPRTEIVTNLGRGISCPLCVGGYVAGLMILIFLIDNILLNFFLLWLGIWGVQVFLENLTSDDAIETAIEDVADSMGE